MTDITVRELYRYPIKGCQGVAVDSIEVSPMGVRGDRSFAIWADGELVDQKETPRVASIAATLDEDGETLVLRHVEHGDYRHRVRESGESHATKWVLDRFDTIDQGDEVAAWLSKIVERPVRLVRAGAAWKINFPIPQFELLHDAPKKRFFAASPVSLANQASLDDLNPRLEEPVSMDRFRVNVVVDGLAPYEEDELVSLDNGEVRLLQVTPAERCVIITTDQKTGERPKNDLMKVLSQYRRKPEAERFGSGVIFSSYMTVAGEGSLRVGDRLVPIRR